MEIDWQAERIAFLPEQKRALGHPQKAIPDSISFADAPGYLRWAEICLETVRFASEMPPQVWVDSVKMRERLSDERYLLKGMMYRLGEVSEWK